MIRSRLLFNDNWMCHLRNDPSEELHVADTFAKALFEISPSASLPWRFHDVVLPHTWTRTSTVPHERSCSKEFAYYKKVFSLKFLAARQHITLTFDGIAGDCDVWINRYWLASANASYLPLTVNITEYLNADGPNVLLVRSEHANGQRYEGAGLYKHVWLETFNSVHVQRDGIYITTPQIGEEEAVVSVKVEIRNLAVEDAVITATAELVQQDGLVLTTDLTSPVSIRRLSGHTFSFVISLKRPTLWHLGSGYLYTCKVQIRHFESGVVLDTSHCNFGVRKIDVFEDGLMVNGKWTSICDVDLHQVSGEYGFKPPSRMLEHKLDWCAELGIYAIRFGHHVITTEVLERADRLGLLVSTEHRVLGSAYDQAHELRTMVRKYRSHPSAFSYSFRFSAMYHEIGPTIGHRAIERILAICQALDDTRPIIHRGIFNFWGSKECILVSPVPFELALRLRIVDEGDKQGLLSSLS